MELKEVCISPDVGARTRAAFNFDEKSDEDLEEDFINFELYEPRINHNSTSYDNDLGDVYRHN
jgi:hypothetical protein